MGVDDARYDTFGKNPGPGQRPGAPQVRFSAIGDAWGLFKQQAGTWIVTGLVVLVANWAITGGVAAVFGKPHIGAVEGFRLQLPPEGQILNAVLSTVLNGFILGGLYYMACKQVKGLPIHVSDLFAVTHNLKELVIGLVLYGLICCVAGMICFLPAFIAAGVLMFTIPLIVDGRLSGVEAVRQSWLALKGQWLTATVFHLVTYLLAGAGILLCCVGLLFTLPLYALSTAVLYRDFFLTKGADVSRKPFASDPDF